MGGSRRASMLAACSKAKRGSSKRNLRKTSQKQSFHIDTMRYVLKAIEQGEYAMLTFFGRYEPIASIPQISAVDPSARAGYSPQVPPSRHLLPAIPFVELVIPPVFVLLKYPISSSLELCSHDDECVIAHADAGRAYNFEHVPLATSIRRFDVSCPGLLQCDPDPYSNTSGVPSAVRIDQRPSLWSAVTISTTPKYYLGERFEDLVLPRERKKVLVLQ